ncbi:MAG: hypothetical protein KAS36_02275 [Anaerolineales bacterium]|jgi:hypothetical protein|nr:hypothetical protein [Anaerolineales bacterium]
MVNNVGDMNIILQSCLDLIQGGQDRLEPILSSYPEGADELRPLLTAALWLWSNRSAFDPRPGFISNSRRRLVASID